MSDNMSNLINQISSMLKNNEIPEEIKTMVSGLGQNNKENSTSSNIATPNKNSSNQTPDIDMETILKIKKVMDSMKETRNDPRANLLRSLKPYLKDSRKDKIEQYIQFLGIEKAFESFGSLGGDKKK